MDIGSDRTLLSRLCQEYGLETYGITLSEEQYAFTNQRIQELGLNKVHVMLRDYRVDMTMTTSLQFRMFERDGKPGLSTLRTSRTISYQMAVRDSGITGQHYGAGVDLTSKYILGLRPKYRRERHTRMETYAVGRYRTIASTTKRRKQGRGMHHGSPKPVADVAKHSLMWDLYLQGSVWPLNLSIDVIQF
ncbi:MAG: SAM-dependent methyltransferase [Streptococcus sp.]